VFLPVAPVFPLIAYNGALQLVYGINSLPAGWHLPSDAEWTTLSDYLTNKGYGDEGSGDDIAKSLVSTTGWNRYSEVGTLGN
jgi:uncharacterized protein (TIGR02145 family)